MKTQTIKSLLALIFLVALLVPMTSALTIKSVIATPSEVAPGQVVDLDLVIENELGEDIENVVVSLNLDGELNPLTGMPVSMPVPFAPYGSSTEVTIEEINDGDDETADFDLIALSDAEAGIYKIPVTISYVFNSTPVEKTSSISLTVNSDPEFRVDYEGLLIKGKKNTVEVRITNTGLTEAKFLSINVDSGVGFKILDSKSFYIGDIESDDFDNVDFNVFVERTAGSVISLPVNLIYKDVISNEIKTETLSLKLTTYSKDQAIELGLIKKNYNAYYAGGVIAVIILWIIYRKIKKYRRNKKKKKEA